MIFRTTQKSRTSIERAALLQLVTAHQAATADVVEIAAGAVDVPEAADADAVVVVAAAVVAVGVTAAVAMADMVATAAAGTNATSFPRLQADFADQN